MWRIVADCYTGCRDPGQEPGVSEGAQPPPRGRGSKARTSLVGPRLSASNPRLLIGWQTHPVNSQPAAALVFGGVHARAVRKPGPLPLVGPLRQTLAYRVQVDGLNGLPAVFGRARRVAVIKERAPQPGRAINLPKVPCPGDKEPSRRAQKASDLYDRSALLASPNSLAMEMKKAAPSEAVGRIIRGSQEGKREIPVYEVPALS